MGLPRFEVRRTSPGVQPPDPGSRTGGTGTPRHAFRCPDPLWGAAVQSARQRGLEWGPVLRGYTAAFVAGTAPVFPDPMAGEPDDDVGG